MKMILALMSASAMLAGQAYAACTAFQPDEQSLRGAWLAKAGPNTLHTLLLKEYADVEETLIFGTKEHKLKGRWALSRLQMDASSDDNEPPQYFLEIRQRSGHVVKNRLLSYDCQQLMLKDSYGKLRTYYRIGGSGRPAAQAAVAPASSPPVTSNGAPTSQQALLQRYRENPDAPEVQQALQRLSPAQRRAAYLELSKQR